MSKKIKTTIRALCTLAILLAFSLSGRAQVAVAPLELVRQQFLSSTGVPLAGGCINFFTTGTSTPQAIYTDSGGVNQLPNPLTLDAAGEASVWMSNIGYDIVANTGVVGQPCSLALGTQLWKEINKNPFSIINGGSNYIVASGTSDPSGSPGMLAYRSDIPCLRFFISTWDCVVETMLPQTLTNKTSTLDANTIHCATDVAGQFARDNGTKLVCSAIQNGDIVVSIGNAGSPGTIVNELAVLAGSGLAVVAPLGAGSGGTNQAIVGVVVSGAGTTGNALIQQTGIVPCVFSGATTASDYVQMSASNIGQCSDTGSNLRPVSGQIVGRAISTNGVAGTYPVLLLAPEQIGNGSATTNSTVNKQDTQGSATTGTGSAQVVFTYTMPANTLAGGKCLNITYYVEKLSGTNIFTPQLTFGATILSTAVNGTGNIVYELTAKVCNNTGSGVAQWAGFSTKAQNIIGAAYAAPAENTAGSIVITGTANVSAPDTWKGMGFVVVTDP